MKRLLAILLALTMMIGLVSVASAEGKSVSVFYGGGTPQYTDPALNSASSGSNIIKLGHAGLMGWQLVDGKPTISPELAESYTISEDKTEYVFTLREGLKWSDGSDFFASDIVKSWVRAASPELGADYAYMFDYVARNEDGSLAVVADDAARTVTVKLPVPQLFFLELCAFPTYFPVKAEAADNQGIWAVNPETNIGMGAYKMVKYAVDDVIVFERNPYYWNADAVKIDTVNCYLSEDNTAILTAYESNAASFINAIDPVEYDRLYATYPGELVMGDYIGTYYVLFNVHKDLSPAGKTLTVQEQSKARFALGQMVNRQDLVDYVTMGGQAPAIGFLPSGLSDGLNTNVRAAEGYGAWYQGTATPSEENPDYTVDQVAACKTLIELGYGYTGSIEGGDIKFLDVPGVEFSFNNSGANAAIIAYVQETWNTFGIPSTIGQEAWGTLQAKLKKGDGEVSRMGWIADFNDAINFLEIFISNSGNNYPRLGKDLGDYTRNTENTKDAGLGAYWGFEGNQTWAEAYDALVDRVRVTEDMQERAALCAEAEKVLMASGGAAPLYYYTNPYMLKPNVENLIMTSTGDVIWTYADIK